MKKLIIPIVLSTIFILTANAPREEGGLSVGDNAPDFKLKNIDGNTVSITDYSDAKGLIITFTCNTCPYAVGYEDRIIALDKKYASKGYPVIAINPNDLDRQPDDSMEKMKVRAQEKGFTFPYLRDDSQDVARAYGATKTPHMYVLKKEGSNFKVAYIGAIDDNPRDGNKASKKYVEDAVDALLVGKEVETTKAKAIGCTIKWKQS